MLVCVSMSVAITVLVLGRLHLGLTLENQVEKHAMTGVCQTE